MTIHDVLVVGSGIFGSVIARHLALRGMSVVVADDARPERGSDPAGCVIKPSWVSSMSRQDVDAALELLAEQTPVHTVDFVLNPGGKIVRAFRVDPSKVLVFGAPVARIVDKVDRISDYGHCVISYLSSSELPVTSRRVVVAAGLWTPELCPWVETWGRWGWAFRGLPVAVPSISIWAPYKQVVALNLDDGMSWSGDGSALIEKTFRDPSREAAARGRVERHVSGITRVLRGVRPYASLPGRDPCLVAPRGRVIAVTGGAKNGTIAAAWAARRIEEMVR